MTFSQTSTSGKSTASCSPPSPATRAPSSAPTKVKITREQLEESVGVLYNEEKKSSVIRLCIFD